ncbi:MAG: sugar ABC transporter permease [Vampirovibrio sp.]
MRRNPPLKSKAGLYFILPVVLGLLTLNYLPSLYALVLSVQSWNLLDAPQWVGLENYHNLLRDPTFGQTLQSTALYVGGVLIAEVLGALLIAHALHRLTRGKRFFQVLCFVPYVAPAMAVSLIFAWLYQPEQGLFNSLLLSCGLLKSPVAWLFTPWTALVAVMSLEVWKSTGYNMLLILGALQALPTAVDESACLDGAKGLSKWWYITLPQLAPTLFLLILMTSIHALQAFDSIYLLTQGGPNRITTVLAYALYEAAFQRFEIGQATALGFVMFSLIAGLTALQWWAKKHWVWQEAQVQDAYVQGGTSS